MVEHVAVRLTPADVKDPGAATERLNRELYGPDGTWLVSASGTSDAPLIARGPSILSDHDVRRLTDQGKLRDISKLQFSVKSLSAELTSMIAADDGEIYGELLYLCGILERASWQKKATNQVENAGDSRRSETMKAVDENIQLLSTFLSSLHVHHPRIAQLAMQGALASVASLIGAKGCKDAGGRILTTDELLEHFELLARFHLVDCLLTHAADANTRYFHTTGFDFLDDNGPDKRTTKGSVLDKIEKQLDKVLRALELYDRGCTVPLGDRRLRLINEDPARERGTILEAALNAEIARTYEGASNDNDEASKHVARSLKRMRKRLRRCIGDLRALKSNQKFRQEAAWLGRGPHPLQMLWLNVSIAAGWLGQHGEFKKERDEGSEDIRILNFFAAIEARGPSRMHSALLAISQGAEAVPPCLSHRHDVAVAQRLFFLLRQLVVQDPDSEVMKTLKTNKTVSDLLHACQIEYQSRQSQPTSNEAFSNHFSGDAVAWYESIKDKNDQISRSVIDEAHVYLSLRLRT